MSQCEHEHTRTYYGIRGKKGNTYCQDCKEQVKSVVFKHISESKIQSLKEDYQKRLETLAGLYLRQQYKPNKEYMRSEINLLEVVIADLEELLK